MPLPWRGRAAHRQLQLGLEDPHLGDRRDGLARSLRAGMADHGARYLPDGSFSIYTVESVPYGPGPSTADPKTSSDHVGRVGIEPTTQGL
jgi:hypothetical protein